MFRLPNDRPALMGILNVTPDSFSDGGLHLDKDRAVARAIEMMDEGADLIDVGGESTRPGAEPVTEQEELNRTISVVEELTRQGIPVSIDTMKPAVADAALGKGAFLVNDVSGFRNPDMRQVVEGRQASVCIMHMQGEPRTMQAEPSYGDVVQEVRDYLIEAAQTLNLPRDQVWIDPGIGFGKTVDHNLSLLKHLSELVATGYPVLVGVSRKSFLGKVASSTAPLSANDRLEATLAAQVSAQLQGARIIRAHDVKASARAIRITAAVLNAR